MDFANRLAREGTISRHPFDSETGVAWLSANLADPDPDNTNSAISAASCLPFIKAQARDALLHDASQHVDPLVRLEAAWAMARLGSEAGRERLVEFCRDPRLLERASLYLEEVGAGKRIPAETRHADFRAMAEMSGWLAHPMEFGRIPDEITQYDSRELKWPPTGRRHRFWLFKYRYGPRSGFDGGAGIGLVGSTTFALWGSGPDLSPEDVYGIHCYWEMERDDDPPEPPERRAAVGRKLIARINPGFDRT